MLGRGVGWLMRGKEVQGGVLEWKRRESWDLDASRSMRPSSLRLGIRQSRKGSVMLYWEGHNRRRHVGLLFPSLSASAWGKLHNTA